jgi:ribosome-binding protein aMBF1 (putative translation factor)
LEKKLSGIIDCEKVGINPESFEECFEELYKLIEKEKDKKIYVDISSTTKIATAVTFSLASIFNVIPFIVIPEENEKLEKKYIELIKSERNRKGISLYELPIIKHEKILGKKEIVILKILKGKGTTLKGMSKLLKLMKITPTKKELTKLKYILNKMRNKNLIELIKRGREIEIKLTSFGKILAKLIS